MKTGQRDYERAELGIWTWDGVVNLGEPEDASPYLHMLSVRCESIALQLSYIQLLQLGSDTCRAYLTSRDREHNLGNRID